MNEFEQKIIQLAETYSKQPEKFISALENSFNIPSNMKGKFFLEVGNILYKFSYFVLSRNSWNYALKYFIKIRDITGESNCYGNLGLAYWSLGDFRKAIEYYERSLKIAKEIGNRAGESNCYGNLGNAYWSLGDFRKAIEYLEKFLDIAKEIGNRAGESKCYMNLGHAYWSGCSEIRKSKK